MLESRRDKEFTCQIDDQNIVEDVKQGEKINRFIDILKKDLRHNPSSVEYWMFKTSKKWALSKEQWKTRKTK